MRKPFEESDEVREAVEKLKALAKELERGDLLTWDKIEEALQLKRDDPKCRYRVMRWRRSVHDDRGIQTWRVPGVGIRFLEDGEIGPVEANSRARMAGRQHRRIMRAMTNARMSKLTDFQRLQKQAIIDNSKRAASQSFRVARDSTADLSDNERMMRFIRQQEEREKKDES